MKRNDAIMKYGKTMFSKMQKHLNGITISIINGEEHIPESDLERAYKQVKGKKVHPLDWD